MSMVRFVVDTEQRAVYTFDRSQKVGELNANRKDGSWTATVEDPGALGLVEEPTGDSPLNAQRASAWHA